jgi:hypothetical protein
MVNGHILLAVSPVGTSPADEFRNPAYFLEYDYTTNTFTQVTSIIPGLGVDSIAGNTCADITFLDLPDGTVLMLSSQNGANSRQYYVYTPGSGPIAQGKPTINNIIPDSYPYYKITGKLFNGISEGASYGDDLQMATNYPLIRLTNAAGNVYYCKTTNWNRIGAIMTDSLEDTALFEIPSPLPAGTYSLVVVANGFASSPFIFTSTGIAAIINSYKINIYPNPSNGIFMVQSKSEEVIVNSIAEVYNMLGEKVLTKTLRCVENNNTIDMSNEPNGVYLYIVVADTGELIGEGKLIVQK